MKSLVVRIVHFFDNIIPKKNAVVLRGYPDIEDQCLSVLMALSRCSYRGKITWIVSDPSWSRDALNEKYGIGGLRITMLTNRDPRALVQFLISKYVFFTHGLYTQGLWGNFAPPKNKMVINLWHGMPMKTIWKLLPTPIEAPLANILLATSSSYREILSRCSGIEDDAIWVAGLPRNDMLLFRDDQSEEAVSILVGGKRWILYLPTYRKSKEGYITNDGSEFDSVLNMSREDAHALNEWLVLVDLTIVVKPHPMSIHAGEVEEEFSNIVFISDKWFAENTVTLYELAGYSMGLMSDISSIMVDYLLLERPVFVYFPDRDAYKGNRGVVFNDLDANLPGKVCRNTTELIYQIDQFVKGNDLGRASREYLREQWHTKIDGRYADLLLSRLDICENNSSS